jgi:CheY-like chemotaxis protein
MLKILVVEDIEDSMEIAERALKGQFEILKAYDGEQAVEISLKERPDLILMDINLPVMNGLKAVHKIKKCSHMKNVPIVAISASTMPNNIEDALDAGCIDFIGKPIRPKELKKKIEKIIGEYYG